MRIATWITLPTLLIASSAWSYQSNQDAHKGMVFGNPDNDPRASQIQSSPAAAKIIEQAAAPGAFGYASPAAAGTAGGTDSQYGNINEAVGVKYFTDPSKLSLGPQTVFLSSDGKPLVLSSLFQGEEVVAKSPGGLVACTVDITGGQQKAQQVNNNRNQKVSWAVATGGKDETAGVFGCKSKDKKKSTLSRLGMKKKSDTSYYYADAALNAEIDAKGPAAEVDEMLYQVQLDPKTGQVNDKLPANLFGGGGGGGGGGAGGVGKNQGLTLGNSNGNGPTGGTRATAGGVGVGI